MRSARSGSSRPSSALTRAAAALMRPSQRTTPTGMPRPETGKLSIALRVSGPTAHSIRCPSGVVGRSRLHLRARHRPRQGAALSSARDPARRRHRGRARAARGPRTLACGVGPVEAALATRPRSPRSAPRRCCTSASPARARRAGSRCSRLVIGTRGDRLRPPPCRSQPSRSRPTRRCSPPPAGRCPTRSLLPIGTSARVGGSDAASTVEAMEGFAVLRGLQLTRACPRSRCASISNEIEEADRARWRFDEALAALAARDRRGCSRRSRVRELTLRLLALPQRHVRVPRARARAASTAPFTVRAGAARHRGAEPRAPARASSSSRSSAFGALAGARATATAAAQRRRARPRLRAARRRARGARRSPTRPRAAIAIPGRDTTAFLLLRLAAPALGEVVELRYDEILDAVAARRGRRRA